VPENGYLSSSSLMKKARRPKKVSATKPSALVVGEPLPKGDLVLSMIRMRMEKLHTLASRWRTYSVGLQFFVVVKDQQTC
jgi:hypothetical protein